VTYNCVEQAYQSLKAVIFHDNSARTDIMATDSPFEQKRLGNKVRPGLTNTFSSIGKAGTYR